MKVEMYWPYSMHRRWG